MAHAKNTEWWICRFENGEYIGQDEIGGFTRVKGMDDAYLAVEGELDDSADILADGEDYEILKISATKEKRTILIDNFFK